MSSLKKAALWTTGLALLVKLSGFIREAVVAKEFGASAATDGYYLAFSFITLIIAMIASGFNSVFLPLYIKRRNKGIDPTDKNANALLNWTVILFLFVSLAGSFSANWLVPLVYPSTSPEAEEVAINMTEVFFTFMVFIALAAILESYLQSKRIFVPTLISKLLATLMAAVFALLFIDYWGIYSIAYGFIAGTIIGVIIQFIYLAKSNYAWGPTLKMESDFRKAFLILIVPSLLNSVVGQINLFVNKAFASSTGLEGAVTYLNNAQLIISIPNAIYATTIAAIIFTLMSEQTENMNKFKDTVFLGMEISFIMLVPVAAGLLVVGESAIAFIYERGEFTDIDTAFTHNALLLYIPIIIFQGMQLILSRSMFARGQTALVFRISVTTIAVNLLLNWMFVDDFGYLALAFAASFVSFYYFTVSLIVVYKDLGIEQFKRFAAITWRILIPAAIMAAGVWGVKMALGVDDWRPILQLAVLVPVGAIIYPLMLLVFHRDGVKRFINLLRRKK